VENTKKSSSGAGKTALKAVFGVVGTLVIALGLLGNFGVLGKMQKTLSLPSFFSSFISWYSDLSAWGMTTFMLAGVLILAIVLNSVDAKSKDGALNSKLVRTPIKRWFALFLLPTFAAFSIGFLFPFIKGVFLSFTSFKTTKKWTWNGLTNYKAAFADKSFTYSFWYTALFAVVSLIIINVLAFLIAYALTRGIKGSNIFRTVFFMPNLIGGIVLGYIWSMIFDGILINYDTSVVLETKYGFWGLIILMAWQQIGYMMIIYIAGIQNVPEDIIEAAKIDGANGRQTLFHIIIPNVMPSITICSFLTLTNSFKLFDQNLALTAGRPFSHLADGTAVHTTEMLALNIYNSFYSSVNSRGAGQAKAVIFFVLVAILGILQLKASHSREVQQ